MVERRLAAAVSGFGAEVLRNAMQDRADRADRARPTPPGFAREGRRPIWVRSLWGDFQILRAYYSQDGGGEGDAPADRLLGIWQSYTPATAAALCRLAAQMPFEQAAELLRATIGTQIGARQIHRFVEEAATLERRWTAALEPPPEAPDTLYISFDGTGVPMRPEWLAGRAGRGEDGTAKTREMRLCCVFTQTATDEEGRAVRDPDSTTYVAALLDSALFGREVKAEALRRGLRGAGRVVVITDGAKWCATQAALFPQATHILDFYHAAEHLGDLAQAILGKGKETDALFARWRTQLKRGQAPSIVDEARGMLGQAAAPTDAEREIAYFEGNLKRLRYDQFLKEGLFIGSGVIEAGCRTAVGQRAKSSGMHWSVPGVQNVLDLRCALLSGRMDKFLKDTIEQRRAA